MFLAVQNRIQDLNNHAGGEKPGFFEQLGQEYYVSFYDLFEPPFQLQGTDPRFVYLSEQFRNVISLCLQAVRDRIGLTMVLGASGTGKSSLCAILKNRLLARSDYRLITLENLACTPTQLMLNILHEVGQESVSRQVETLKRQFQTLLLEEFARTGNPLIIVVDEAQTATKYNLELLRQLLNFEQDGEKLLQIILFGQEDLARKIAARPNFLSRVVSQMRLSKLSTPEVTSMLNYRLAIAGAGREIFSQSALEAISVCSKGLPGEVCKIGYTALLLGATRNEKLISRETVDEACKNWQD